MELQQEHNIRLAFTAGALSRDTLLAAQPSQLERAAFELCDKMPLHMSYPMGTQQMQGRAAKPWFCPVQCLVAACSRFWEAEDLSALSRPKEQDPHP